MITERNSQGCMMGLIGWSGEIPRSIMDGDLKNKGMEWMAGHGWIMDGFMDGIGWDYGFMGFCICT